MAYAFVFLVAVSVGVGVYVTTLRGNRDVADGLVGPAGGPPQAGPGGTYVPVVAGTPDWQSRLTGFLGLVISIVVGAVLMAATLYVGVSWLVRVIAGAFGSDEASPGG
jgi:hypothetical protein